MIKYINLNKIQEITISKKELQINFTFDNRIITWEADNKKEFNEVFNRIELYIKKHDFMFLLDKRII